MKAAIWIRVSTDEQAQGSSPEHHLERAKAYSKAKDWEITQIYDLSGVSGKSVIEHPEAQRMLRDVKAGRIQALIFSKLARLARNTKELLEFSQLFQDSNVAMISLEEAIDTSSPAGRLFYTIIAAMAQWEREEIASRVKSSVKVRAKLGKSLGGAAPYGYSWDNGKLILNDKEAHIRKKMFELFLEVQKKKTVVNILNSQGLRTRKGSKFSAVTLKRLLSDPIAKGLRRINYTQSLGEGKHWIIKDEKEWEYTEAPSIVSEELWNRVNRILKEQSNSHNYPKKTVRHIFTGYLECECGGSMIFKHNTGKYICKSCRSKIEEKILEQIFKEKLKTYSLSKEALEHQFENSISELQNVEQNKELLEEQKKEADLKIESLIELHSKGKIPTERFDKHFQPLSDQFEEISNEIDRLETFHSNLNDQKSSIETLIQEAQNLYSSYDNFSSKEKRKIIEAVLDRIVIKHKEIEIKLIQLSPNLRLLGNTTMPLRLF